MALPSKDVDDLRTGDASVSGSKTLEATYTRPYQSHGSIGPSCAVAQFVDGAMTVWSRSTQGVHPIGVSAIAEMLRMPLASVRLIHVEGSGCYGHNGADDAAADAASIARALPGRPVRVQWMREQEHAWEPFGPRQWLRAEGLCHDGGKIADWQFEILEQHPFDEQYVTSGSSKHVHKHHQLLMPAPAAVRPGPRDGRSAPRRAASTRLRTSTSRRASSAAVCSGAEQPGQAEEVLVVVGRGRATTARAAVQHVRELGLGLERLPLPDRAVGGLALGATSRRARRGRRSPARPCGQHVVAVVSPARRRASAAAAPPAGTPSPTRAGRGTGPRGRRPGRRTAACGRRSARPGTPPAARRRPRTPSGRTPRSARRPW